MSFPRYPKYKDSGVEWLGEVPEHWEVEQTKRLFRLVAEPAPDDNDCELLSIYTEIGVRPRKDLEAKGNKATTTDGYWKVQKGDLIVNKLLAWMGAIGISAYEGVTSPAYDILRKIRELEPQFYDYLFRCGICFTEFRRYSRGIMDMRLRLYFEDFGQLRMPFPPIEDQQQIISFLDHETAKIDELVAEQRRLIELLKEKRQAAISHAVTKGLNPNVALKPSGIEWLGDVPKHWDVKKIKHLSSRISSGKTPLGGSEVYIDEGITFLRSQNVYDEGLRLDDVVFIAESVDEAMAVSRVMPNDILLNITGASIGRSCVVPCSFPSANVNQHVCVIRLKQAAQVPFVGWLFKSATIKNQIDHSQNGAAREGLNFAQIGEMAIAMPPDEEQGSIASFLNNQTEKLDALTAEAQHGIELLQERRTALISAAVTGKIDVRQFVAKEEAA